MSERLDGTVALITGASSGIGAATALELATHGAAVALVARRVDRLESLAEMVRAKVHNRPEVLAGIKQRFDGVERLQAEDIADAIGHIVTRPRHVAVNEMLVRPTRQQN